MSGESGDDEGCMRIRLASTNESRSWDRSFLAPPRGGHSESERTRNSDPEDRRKRGCHNLQGEDPNRVEDNGGRIARNVRNRSSVSSIDTSASNQSRYNLD